MSGGPRFWAAFHKDLNHYLENDYEETWQLLNEWELVLKQCKTLNKVVYCNECKRIDNKENPDDLCICKKKRRKTND